MDGLSPSDQQQLDDDLVEYGERCQGQPRKVVRGIVPTYKRADLVYHALRLRSPASALEVVPNPEEARAGIDIDALIQERVRLFEVAKARAATMGPRQVRMPPGPYAIAHLGDPHIDDDGCDWPALLRVVETVKKTEGMYAANGGDTTNRWVGFLMKKYADQHTTLYEADLLAEWLLHSMEWVYIMLGNHDLWNNGADILGRIGEEARVGVIQADDIKVELLSPGGHPCRIHARHDFAGHSMWNPAHGPMRSAKMDGWGQVYIGFHRHTAVDHREECDDGVVRWMLRARGFKRFDDYARSKGFTEQKHGEALTTVHDPYHHHPAERVTVFYDVGEAAEFLTWKRGRWRT
jgi:hypothetical protein